MENTVNPYESPKSNTSIPSTDTYEPKLLSLNGRIGRLRYLAYGMIATLAALIIIGIAAAVLMPMVFGNSAEMSGNGPVILILLLYIPLIVISVILMKRRLNDLDRSGWWQLLAYIPLVGILFACYILFWPGTKGGNNYGPQPSKNSSIIIIGALIFPVIIGILAAIAIPTYQDYVERAQQALENQQ